MAACETTAILPAKRGQGMQGQASMEFLLLLAAGLALLAVFAFAWDKTLWLAQASSETAKARSFADRLSAASMELAVLADGSRKTIAAQNSAEWRASSNAGMLEISLNAASGSGEEFSKTLSTELSGRMEDFDFFLPPKSVVALEKSGGVVRANADP
ncbi:MAG: hypothetical protein HY394_06070 [Candidatus Diapherotrites archaeon]|nr:hypothetical protein [Candidatus Diapherotrites archaeon]